MHPRSALRDALVAAVGRVDAFAGNVRATRIDPPSTETLPAATVLTVDETAEADTTGARRRDVRFQVSATIVAGETVDGDLDDLAEAIEAEIGSDAALRALSRSVVLTETRFDLRTESKDGQRLTRPVARIGLVYRITHRTTPTGVAA